MCELWLSLSCAVLCLLADERRHFSGNLAHLAIFDYAMTASQVQGLFADYAGSFDGEQSSISQLHSPADGLRCSRSL